MKITGFYISKNHKVYDDQLIVTETTKMIKGTLKMAVALTVTHSTLPVLMSAIGELGLVAHASPVVMGETSTVVLTNVNLDTNIDNFTATISQIIKLLQTLAKPLAIGFATRGFLYKMAGKDAEGDHLIKGSVMGYLGILFLPFVFDVLSGVIS